MEINTSKLKNWMLVIFRIAIGLLFLTAGFLKLMNPPEVFEVVINYYEVIPTSFAHVLALTLPWLELMLGGYLLLGLWTTLSAYILMGMTFCFQLALGQALMRKISIEQCGCFGEKFLHLTLYQSFLLDTALLLALIYIATTNFMPLALDSLFARKS